jgi:anti-sigma factor RsiW
MDNPFQNNFSKEGEHPTRETLLLCVDGELSSKEAAQVEAHLEACWHCRVKTKKIEEAIAEIIEFDERALKPHIAPQHGWRNFDRQLSQLVAESGKRSLIAQLLGSLGRHFSQIHLTLRHQTLIRVAAGLVVTSIIVALAIMLNREQTVSASELLRHSAEAQANELRTTAQPVVYQKLLVSRRAGQAVASDSAVSLEIWNDANGSRFRQSVTDQSGRRFLPVSAESGGETPDAPEVLIDLAHVLRANHMNPQRPLSTNSYQAWRNSLKQKQEEVTKSQMANGVEALTLRTVPAGPVEVGRIAEATIIVRARDWHPGELRLRVRAEDGDREYQIVETSFEVVTLSAVSPEIFSIESDSQITSSPAPGAAPTVSPSPSLALNANATTLPVMPPRAVATAELEVEVLRLLNLAGADTGEQVSAKRGTDGLLRVEGIVETTARKAEILRALEPVINNPAVRVDVKTVAEALAAESGKGKESSRPPTERRAETTSGTMAAEADLRAYLQSDEQARLFAARMVSRSQSAMRHLYALRRLANQFSTEELRALSPEARAKWLSLVRSHARSYQQELAGLRQELRPIFFPSASQGRAQDNSEVADAVSVVRAIERLFEIGSANDRVILSSFTTSSESSSVTAIKSVAFWQSLQAADSLAVRIQSTK